MRQVLTWACLGILLMSGFAYASQIADVDQSKYVNTPSFLGWAEDRVIVILNEGESVDHGKDASTDLALSDRSGYADLASRFGVVSLKPQFPGSDRFSTALAADNGELARHYKVIFTEGNLDEVVAAYEALPSVQRVERVGIHSMCAVPNDGYYDPYQWFHNQTSDDDIDSPEGWDIQTGNPSIILAILDSGVRYYHPDLGGVNASPTNPGGSRGNMWINNAELTGSTGVDDDGNGFVDDWIGWDFIETTSGCWDGEDCSTQDNDPRDFNGHGTHCAGIVGMLTNDGYGMAGVAGGWGNGSQAEYGNGVKVMACRIGFSYRYLGQEVGVVYMDAAAEAFYYAADNGARLASCSWGSSNSGGIAAAADYFIGNGGLIFTAAGNDGSQTASYLASRSDVISVAATDQNDAAASFTTYGTWVDISAPGVSIYSTYHDHADPLTNYWAALDGTSMACPMAAATGAMIWSQNPTWSNSQVETQLYASAENIDAELTSTYLGKMGAGRINLYNAVNTGPPAAPVAAFTGSPTTGTEPLTVNFTDQSTGTIDTWAWTFGDGGTSTAQNPSHVYNAAGTYTVSLTVTGPGGSDTDTKTNYITVNPCVTPTAGFVGAPTSGDYPLTVNFTDQSTSASSYAWTFGDGGTSTAANPSHTYTAAGTYTVTQTVTNACGTDQLVRTNYITVTTPCLATVANFSGTPTTGDFPLAVNFTDLSTNNPTSWSWTFGDGGTSTAQNPSHTYAAAGTYTVSLTATNVCGSDVETKASYITVTTPGTNAVHVANMVVGRAKDRANYLGACVVTIYNQNNAPMAGVSVSASYDGPTSGTTGGTTAADGTVTLLTSSAKKPSGEWCFTVTNVVLSGYTYDSGANAVTRACESGWVYSNGFTGLLGEEETPTDYSISQNYPNPFNPTTMISFALPQATHVTLTVYNVSGQEIQVLLDRPMSAGEHQIEWNASAQASGIYFYRLVAGDLVEARKMILLK